MTLGRPTVWTRERVIAAMRDWADRHDGRPPTTNAWRRAGRDEPHRGRALADRPSATAVERAFSAASPTDGQLRLFGPWSEAIGAAGFDPLKHRDRTGHRRVLCRRGLHELAGPNLIVHPNGKRRCRACTNSRKRGRATHETLDEARAWLRCARCNYDAAAPGELLCDHCAGELTAGGLGEARAAPADAAAPHAAPAGSPPATRH